MLTDDEFYERVCAQLAAMEEAEKEKENGGRKRKISQPKLRNGQKEEEKEKSRNEGLQEKWRNS